MYLAGTTRHLKLAEATKLAVRLRPEGGKCLIRRDPIGTLELITLSSKPLYPGQSRFKPLCTDTAA